MFARFDENPAMTLRVIKETKRYGRTDGRTDIVKTVYMFARFDENPAMTLRVIKETKRYGRTDGQPENSIPPTNKVCGGYKHRTPTTNGKHTKQGINSNRTTALEQTAA